MILKRTLFSTPVFVIALAAGVATVSGVTVLRAFFWPAPVEAAVTLQPPLVEADPILPAPTPFPVVGLDPTEEAPVQTGSQEVVWYGGFDFDTESLPKAFRDLTYIEIVRYDFGKTDEDGNAGVLIPPKGSLKAGKEFRFKRIGIAGKEIAFQTETVNGVSYRFTGRYLALDFCETDAPTPDLAGELTKIVDGKWAASAKVKLFEQGCGC